MKPVSRLTALDNAGPVSPLVSRRDMKGLIRQVIGQEKSPVPAANVSTTPKHR